MDILFHIEKHPSSPESTVQGMTGLITFVNVWGGTDWTENDSPSSTTSHTTL